MAIVSYFLLLFKLPPFFTYDYRRFLKTGYAVCSEHGLVHDPHSDRMRCYTRDGIHQNQLQFLDRPDRIHRIYPHRLGAQENARDSLR